VKVTRRGPSARNEARDLLALRPAVIDEAVLEQGWKIQERYQLSFWDALIVAAAKSAACACLLTEDLQAGQDLDGVTPGEPLTNAPPDVFER